MLIIASKTRGTTLEKGETDPQFSQFSKSALDVYPNNIVMNLHKYVYNYLI